MMYYACFSVLFVSLTVCLGQSLEEELNSKLQNLQPECKEALGACALPIILPYASATDQYQVLEIVRNIGLGEHCRKTRKSYNCFKRLFGKNQCPNLDPMITAVWTRVAEPVLDEVWNYICVEEFKKFNIHYRCLLTEDVINSVQYSCSSSNTGSELDECFFGVIKEECGKTASEITKALALKLAERYNAIQKEFGAEAGGHDGEDDDGQQQQQSTLPENAYQVYARQLAVLQKLLKRK